MSRITARVVAGVLAAPALLWGVALVVIVTADLPPLGGAAAGLPIASVALISLSGAIVAAIVARRGREHRGDAPPRPFAAATIAASAVVVASAIAIALGPAVSPAPAVADPGLDSVNTETVETEGSVDENTVNTGQRIVFGDHSGHVGYEP
ncbi:MAG: hypothetical protein KJ659_11580 [Actinobacteria bacterium]|nr:hypothetical protein [Actinomycetota bacterium]MBU1608252.1 hypothetical protein [Actinomycetota bacterium]MBU2314490.1 hypothetical protein [Actinomycetota bacterium]MBU2386112.1 hypothetical protein [Actinomycetota bacterium]